MKLLAALGALSSNRSMSISPSSVAIVALVMAGSLRCGSLGSRVADRRLGYGNRVRRQLVAASGGIDRVDGVHARRHRADDLIGIVLSEDGLVLVVQDDEELRSHRVWCRGARHRNGPS